MAKVNKTWGGVEVISASAPRQGSGEFITLNVRFGHFDEEIEFTASPTDGMEYGRELYALAKAGKLGKVKPYVEPPKPLWMYKKELEPLMMDITLGIATEEEIALARELRLKIKELEAEGA